MLLFVPNSFAIPPQPLQFSKTGELGSGERFHQPRYKGELFLANRRTDYLSYPSYVSYPTFASYPHYASYPTSASHSLHSPRDHTPQPQSSREHLRQNFLARAELVCQFLGKREVVRASSADAGASLLNPVQLNVIEYRDGYWVQLETFQNPATTFFNSVECK